MCQIGIECRVYFAVVIFSDYQLSDWFWKGFFVEIATLIPKNWIEKKIVFFFYCLFVMECYYIKKNVNNLYINPTIDFMNSKY